MQSTPPATERRPIYQSEVQYPPSRQKHFGDSGDEEFMRRLRNAPNSSSNKYVVKWDILKEMYNIDSFDSERYYNKLTRKDIVDTCRALHTAKYFRSHEDKNSCLDIKTLVFIALVLILALVFMILGGDFIYGSFGLIVFGVLVIGVKIAINNFYKKDYLRQREKKYKKIAMGLNRGRFIDKPFTVNIGDLGAWVEFNVSFVENDRPNRRQNGNMNMNSYMGKSQEMPESQIISPAKGQGGLKNNQLDQFGNAFTPSPIRIEDQGGYPYGNPQVRQFDLNQGDVRIYDNYNQTATKGAYGTFEDGSFGNRNTNNTMGGDNSGYKSKTRLGSKQKMLLKLKKPALKPDLGSVESDVFETTTRNKRSEKVTFATRNYSNKNFHGQRRIVYNANKENINPNTQYTPQRRQLTPIKRGNYPSATRGRTPPRRGLTPQANRATTPNKRLPPIVRYVSNSPIRPHQYA